jgi:prevent-host-death family protein
MPSIIDIKEAKAELANLLERVIQGEEIVIARDGAPIARWAPVGLKADRRIAGSAKGKVFISSDFEAPLAEDILDTFGL